jgi:hypothetical protein
MKTGKNVAISESGFVLNTASGESFSTNPIGVEILNLLKQDLSFEAIAQTLLEKYDVDFNTFEKDFSDFKNLLNNYHLIESE